MSLATQNTLATLRGKIARAEQSLCKIVDLEAVSTILKTCADSESPPYTIYVAAGVDHIINIADLLCDQFGFYLPTHEEETTLQETKQRLLTPVEHHLVNNPNYDADDIEDARHDIADAFKKMVWEEEGYETECTEGKASSEDETTDDSSDDVVRPAKRHRDVGSDTQATGTALEDCMADDDDDEGGTSSDEESHIKRLRH